MRRLAAVTVVATLLGAVGIEAAAAMGPSLYLVGDSVPSASMITTSPPGGPLPNFDPGRDDFPGLLVKKGDGSAGESDPTKYQRWSHSVGGETLSIEKLEIWAAAKDFNRDKTVIFNVYILDCGGNCQVLDSASATVSGAGKWQKTIVSFDDSDHTFAPGHELSVKIVVDNDSDDDMWFAYGTAAHPAHLSVSSFAGPSPSTTTTSTTSTTTVGAVPPSPGPPIVPPRSPVAPGGSPSTTSTTTSTTTASTTSTTLAEVGALPAVTTTTTTPRPGGGGLEPGLDPSGETGQTGSPGVVSDSPDVLAPVVVSPPVEEADEATLALDQPRPLQPEEGLAVAYSTAVEAIRLHWHAALALGALAAVLLLIGGRRDHEALATTTPVPHHLFGGWFSHPDE
jgi:hypothetical protein